MALSENLHEITRLLGESANGATGSLDEVFALVYAELHGMARQQLRRSSIRESVDTTILLHEAYEKLSVGQVQTPNDRKHFFAIAARAMRQIVVDTYRSSQAEKRGGGELEFTASLESIGAGDDPAQLAELSQALEQLAAEDEELASYVDLACFAGLSTEEIAELNGTTVRTVQRKLKRAQAWLGFLVAGED